MATTNYIDVTAAVSSVCTSCPTLTMINAVRATVIDLCERGQVLRYIHPDVSIVTPTYLYSFVPPDSQTVISMVETARLDDAPIDIVTPKGGMLLTPGFPDTLNLGKPNLVWQMDQRAFTLSPTPDTTYTLKLTTTLKPTITSTGADSTMIQEHFDAIVHGALHRLLLQQKREWFNADLAGYHGKQYTYKMNVLKAVANKGYGQLNLNVAMRPFA